jgi:hypothetical protein
MLVCFTVVLVILQKELHESDKVFNRTYYSKLDKIKIIFR